ncbi:hypothetical protein NA56DRAFT_705542 [Hyaloscypha hepaticicola]|uniref:AB hydrolase-1 domain-containing protein n=1 Tax=Hyaloscypha hepaticicola TaxID=2082293 RepID=A0A2J6PZH6_9HELO|nr:hypothetical protein NA56DRAFT_705542 [Hyaloscypha hepaticicola]
MLHKVHEIPNMLLLLVLLFGAAFSNPIHPRQAVPAGCVNFNIPVTASADNVALPPGLDVSNLLLLLNPPVFEVTSQLASGTFDIAATYCPATTYVEGRENTLQVLLHGATYTKAYWFGLYYNVQNSWVSYAANQGYATLTIDRLGNDPTPDYRSCTLWQPSSTRAILRAKFDKIIAAGHSLGSIVVNTLNWRYPSDADGTVLTGYATVDPLQLAGIFLEAGLAPVIGLPIGYLEITSYSDWLWLFYSEGLYDPGLESYDWNHRGTAALGELAGAAFASQTADQYTGPVLIMTGLHDAVFCSTLTLDIGIPLLGLGGPQTCDTGAGGAVPVTANLYPYARSVEFYYPDGGHCWHLHYAAEDGFAAAHEWMQNQGF